MSTMAVTVNRSQAQACQAAPKEHKRKQLQAQAVRASVLHVC